MEFSNEQDKVKEILAGRMREPVPKLIVKNSPETAKFMEMIRSAYSNDVSVPTNIDIFRATLSHFVETKLKTDPALQWIDFESLETLAEEAVKNSQVT